MIPWLARQLLRLIGWKLIGQTPVAKKYVLIEAPHTSNWDWPIGMCCNIGLRLNARWFGKHTLFRGPLKWFFTAAGGVSIDRRTSHHIVDVMVEKLKQCEALTVTITPEGRRRRSEYWKSGFYHIAHRANVPLVLAYLDWNKKEVGLGATLHLTGNIKADMDIIRDFYKDKTARHPENCGPVRLREEA